MWLFSYWFGCPGGLGGTTAISALTTTGETRNRAKGHGQEVRERGLYMNHHLWLLRNLELLEETHSGASQGGRAMVGPLQNIRDVLMQNSAFCRYQHFSDSEVQTNRSGIFLLTCRL